MQSIYPVVSIQSTHQSSPKSLSLRRFLTRLAYIANPFSQCNFMSLEKDILTLLYYQRQTRVKKTFKDYISALVQKCFIQTRGNLCHQQVELKRLIILIEPK